MCRFVCLWLDEPDLVADYVAYIHRRGLKVLTWGRLNALPTRFDEQQQLGMDGVIVDGPCRTALALKAQSSPASPIRQLSEDEIRREIEALNKKTQLRSDPEL